MMSPSDTLLDPLDPREIPMWQTFLFTFLHGLSKVSPGPAMPYSSMHCGLATPETIGLPAGQAACNHSLPPWTPHTSTFIIKIQLKQIGTRRESINGHRFPMPHLSRRGDKRVEMGHRPRRERRPLISSHMEVYSVRREKSGRGGYIRAYICTDVQTHFNDFQGCWVVCSPSRNAMVNFCGRNFSSCCVSISPNRTICGSAKIKFHFL
jgi:hypothetical protein